jgi:hypothetical protein
LLLKSAMLKWTKTKKLVKSGSRYNVGPSDDFSYYFEKIMSIENLLQEQDVGVLILDKCNMNK